MSRQSKTSLRNQLLIVMLIFAILTIATLWVFESVFFDDYFRYSKLNGMSDISARVVEMTTEEDFVKTYTSGEVTNIASTKRWRDEVIDIADSENVAIGYAYVSSDQTNPYVAMRWSYSGAMPTPALTTYSSEVAVDVLEYYQGVGEEVVYFDKNESTPVSTAVRISIVDLGEVKVAILVNTLTAPLPTTKSVLRQSFALITALLFVVAVAVSYLVSRHVSRPINQITKNATSLPRGEYLEIEDATCLEVSMLNESLTLANEEIKKSDTLQHDLIANISHDLRTPLTLISGYAEMLSVNPSAVTSERLDVIVDEAKYLTELVKDILDLSKIQSGAVQPEDVPLDVTGEIEKVLSRFATLTSYEGYTITFDKSEEVTSVIDRLRFDQVVYNLVGNAISYTGEDKVVVVKQIVEGDVARIEVIDTGYGIPPEEIEDIWRRYLRGATSHSRAKAGSGLGLSIVKKIFDTYSLRYGVESGDGGSTFWFELPIYRGE